MDAIEWISNNRNFLLGVSVFFSFFLILFRQQVSSLKEQNESLRGQLEHEKSFSYENVSKLIESKNKVHDEEMFLVKKELQEKIELLKNEYKSISKNRKDTYINREPKENYQKLLGDRINDLEESLEKIVHNSGSMDLSYVAHQGNIGAFATRIYSRGHLTVGNIPEYMADYLQKNIDSKYLNRREDYHNTYPSNVDRYEFLINSTRISTFICITDGERILLFDRIKSNKQEVINNKYDCFGSVTFENISIGLKIDQTNISGFLNSVVENIEFIPGFSYEDNLDPTSGKQTVIMFGFLVYVKSDDIDILMREKNKELMLISVLDGSISKEVLTSKADLARDFLREKILEGK